jgi:ribulose-phosphate 3-epimerase
MTVQPGYSGQKFIKTPLQKIKEIKKYNPVIIVGVDGGINTQTCRMTAHADADFAIATHAVTEAEDPKKAYKELMKRC